MIKSVTLFNIWNQFCAKEKFALFPCSYSQQESVQLKYQDDVDEYSQLHQQELKIIDIQFHPLNFIQFKTQSNIFYLQDISFPYFEENKFAIFALQSLTLEDLISCSYFFLKKYPNLFINFFYQQNSIFFKTLINYINLNLDQININHFIDLLITKPITEENKDILHKFYLSKNKYIFNSDKKQFLFLFYLKQNSPQYFKELLIDYTPYLNPHILKIISNDIDIETIDNKDMYLLSINLTKMLWKKSTNFENTTSSINIAMQITNSTNIALLESIFSIIHEEHPGLIDEYAISNWKDFLNPVNIFVKKGSKFSDSTFTNIIKDCFFNIPFDLPYSEKILIVDKYIMFNSIKKSEKNEKIIKF